MVAEDNGAIERRVFVGRERELAELRGGLDDALGGRSRLFLVVGEPGIGKTRLADEVCGAATARGALPLWGRCWEGGGAPAYWPWIQIVRGLLRGTDAAALALDMGAGAARIAQIVPEVRDVLRDLPHEAHPAPLDPEQARFPLFDAVSTFLLRATARRPLVLVLDDLHAADPPSLLLLQFVARESRDARVLLIGTYRPLEVERQPERAQILGAIARHGSRLPLSGLSESQVADLMARVCAAPPAPALVAAVYQTTEGNPFFVDELVRLLVAERGAALTEDATAALRIPHGVREAIRERLRPLSDTGRQVLCIAAAIGREFDLAWLAPTCELAAAALLDVLGEAAALGIVGAVPGTLGRYSFTHALFRETLYEELPVAMRVQLHRRIGEVIERLHAQDRDVHAAELAHHFFQAAAGGDVEKAIVYATRAGDRAAAQLAHEDAAAHYQRALQALDHAPLADDVRRATLWLALGRVRRASASADARDMFQYAADLARRLVRDRRPEGAALLARAALGVADRGLGTPQISADRDVVRVVEEALAALGAEDSALRARLLGRLAMERSFSEEDHNPGVALSVQAVEMARRLGDPITLAATLTNQQFILWCVDNISDRLAISREIVELAEGIGDKELALQGRTWRLMDLMGSGDVQSFDREIDIQARSAEELRQPRYLWTATNLRAMRALWAGRWEEAEALAQRSLALGERTGDQFAAISPLVQIFLVRREQGRLADEEPGAHFFAERYPASPLPRTLLAIIYHDLGRTTEMREQFERLAADDFVNLRRERRLGVLPYLSEICAALGDSGRAALLYDLLAPYSHAIMPYGGVVSFGAGGHYLGLLAAAMGRRETAREHFEYALALHTRTGGRPWLVRTQCEYAHFLLAGDEAYEHRHALELAEQAFSGATELQMIAVAPRAAGLVERARTLPEHPPATPHDEAARARAYGSGGVEAPATDAAAPAPPRDEPTPERERAKGRVLSFPKKPGATKDHLSAETPARAGREHDSPPPSRRGTQPDEGIFRLDGEYWSVGDSAAILRLKDTKGLRYIAYLLRHPGREFHATELVALEHAPVPTNGAQPLAHLSSDHLAQLGMRSSTDGGAEEHVLDARAKAAYKQRLADLREELDEATGFNDIERAARARAEIEFLSRELARAVGLGGRDRPNASHAERARLNVTRAIKAVLKRIEQRNPQLGRTLSSTIKTGSFCSYNPDPRLPITWKL